VFRGVLRHRALRIRTRSRSPCMKSKFEPDIDSGARETPSARLIDPEAFDASEQQFAASVEEKAAPLRFVMDAAQDLSSGSAADQPPEVEAFGNESRIIAASGPADVAPTGAEHAQLVTSPDSDSWRSEVAARVGNYRARRRPRTPRYPSLQLKFEAPEPPSTAHTAAAPSRLAVAVQATFAAAPPEEELIQRQPDEPDRLNVMEAGGARILEFPRPAVAPPLALDELAEPVMDRPRILEVPDLMLPPPALGGILMEPVEQLAQERRPGFELPLQAAPMSKRLLAGGTDSLLVVTAFAVFACIFFKITSVVPALQQGVSISVALVALFWIAYQYLLLVYCGTTPGLMLAHLQLSRFDGTAVPRRIRRWRALASVLSGFSLALGYAWCFLDEDRLCWHDRITRTYMAPKSAPPVQPNP
jgi:uncharacterized RDD family membrane protein YckC